MLNFIIKKIVGSQNERQVKKMRPLVKKINDLEAALQPLSDDALREKTAAWKTELSQIKDDGELARRLEGDPARKPTPSSRTPAAVCAARKSRCATIRSNGK